MRQGPCLALVTDTANFLSSGRVCSLCDGLQDQEFTMHIKNFRRSGKNEACNYMRVHKAR